MDLQVSRHLKGRLLQGQPLTWAAGLKVFPNLNWSLTQLLGSWEQNLASTYGFKQNPVLNSKEGFLSSGFQNFSYNCVNCLCPLR